MDSTRKSPSISRATKLSDVAAWSSSHGVFQRNLRDWSEHVAALPARAAALASVVSPPRPLRTRFPEGAVADAWLAACAEYVCLQLGAAIPEWALKSNRFLTEPSFDSGVIAPRLRAIAMDQSPEAFRRRNIFTTAFSLPLKALLPSASPDALNLH